MMPTLNQWETVKAQCSGFNELGFIVKCELNYAGSAIRISKGLKTWKFSEPDWEVVIKQLAQLWKTLKLTKTT